MPLKFLDDPGPTLGMVRDQPSWELPPGALYDSLNLAYDVQGIGRQRMGSTALVSGAQTAFCSAIGFCYSQDATVVEELYGIDTKAKNIYLINKSTGATTSIGGLAGTANFTPGRPIRHFGWVFFPWSDAAGLRRSTGLAGQTVSTVFTSTATSTLTAGNQQITLSGGDTTTNIKVGGNVTANVSPTYRGRVVSIDSATLFTVWPTPTFTATAAIGALQSAPMIISGLAGGACAASFQNRLLYGNTADFASVGTTLVSDRRIYYSPLPTESGINSIGTISMFGATFVSTNFWPALNYFEVSGQDPIIAMEPVSDNQLLILTSTHPVIFSGNLTTQLATTNPTVTWDLSDINVPAGCLSDLSVQRTKRGVVWAGVGGVFAWNGRSVDTLTGDDKTKRIASYWQALASDVSTFVIHGSAYVRDHYIVSGSSGGVTFSLMCNMQNLQWTRLSGVGTDIFFGVARPSIPQQVFASRWWDQSGAAPSMTNGQTLRLESMLSRYVAGATTTDADGTAVTLSATTRTITGDPELQKMFQRATVRHQQSSTTAAVTVTAQSKIDAADISAASVRAIGSLSNTSVLTVSSATNANPIVVTTSANHGLQSDDFVDIDGVTGNTNANGRWRIIVTGNTTFSLVGGIGNGASGGSPTCKKMTETDYLISTLNAGQGVSYKFDGAPNNFELHGTRTAVLQRDPVMSS